MNNKIVGGALIVIVAGLATFFYMRRKNRLNFLAADAYDIMDTNFRNLEKRTENFLKPIK